MVHGCWGAASRVIVVCPLMLSTKRRLLAIQKVDVAEKRQVLQLLDEGIERGQLKRKAHATTRR